MRPACVTFVLTARSVTDWLATAAVDVVLQTVYTSRNHRLCFVCLVWVANINSWQASVIDKSVPCRKQHLSLLVVSSCLYTDSNRCLLTNSQTGYIAEVGSSSSSSKGKGKAVMEHRVTATECHLSYGITQCYLLPNTSEHTPPSPQPDRPVLDLPTPEGWKAELT